MVKAENSDIINENQLKFNSNIHLPELLSKYNQLETLEGPVINEKIQDIETKLEVNLFFSIF